MIRNRSLESEILNYTILNTILNIKYYYNYVSFANKFLINKLDSIAMIIIR